MAEFQIRALVRRLDNAEIELREVKAGTGYYDDAERRQRVRVLRRWIAADEARLRSLLGGNNQKSVAEISKCTAGA